MQISIKPQKELCVTLILLFTFANNICLAQSNDAYLDALQGEASELSLDGQTKSKKSITIDNSTNSASKIFVGDGLTANLSYIDFLETLKVNYIGTYFFLKRLNENNKMEVYSFYLQNNDPKAIRQKVIQISKKK